MRLNNEWLEDEETQKQLRELARWLLIVPLILLLFGCGSLALLETRAAKVDTRSQMQADYSQWPFMVIQPINPEIVEEIKRDKERYEEPEEGEQFRLEAYVTQYLEISWDGTSNYARLVTAGITPP